MNLTGDAVLAPEGSEWGLVDALVPDEELFDTAIAWARKLAGQAPLAVEQIKQVSNGADLDEGIEAEKQGFATAFLSEDGKEGISAFLRQALSQVAGQVATDQAERLAELIRESPLHRRPHRRRNLRAQRNPGLPNARRGPLGEGRPDEGRAHRCVQARSRRFWSFYRPRLHSLGGVEPNDAHRALAELERRNLLEAVVTQNIDMLHHKAGSERVIEVHGSIKSGTCQDVRCRRSALEEIDELFDDEGVAICDRCAGHVKPDVVLFGELLPAEAIAEAEALAARAELMLCIGTSLEVFPVAGLPSITIGSGGGLAIITKGPTPFDTNARVRMDGDVVADLEAVLAALS